MDLFVYIDESGTIPKPEAIVNDEDCFVLGIIISTKPSNISRKFRKGILSLTKRYEKYNNELTINKEIKGSHIPENKKSIVYQYLFDKDNDTFEIGIIQLHNSKADDKFRKVPARAFNYLIWKFMHYYFYHNKIIKEPISTVNFIIDERNIAPEAKHDLAGYLEMQNFEEEKSLFENINVRYVDSTSESLVQLADMVANSFYRYLRFNKSGTEAKSLSMLNSKLVNGCIFEYPKH